MASNISTKPDMKFLMPSGRVTVNAVFEEKTYLKITPEGAVSGTNYLKSQPIGSIDLVIPDTINGVAVTSIDKDAFNRFSSLNSVIIPNGIITIGDNAFSLCYYLTIADIPNKVTNIGINAFDGCEALTSINIPNSVTSIDVAAFYGCSEVTSVTIGNGIEFISIDAFEGCWAITSFNINKPYNSIEGEPWGASNSIINWIG